MKDPWTEIEEFCLYLIIALGSQRSFLQMKFSLGREGVAEKMGGYKSPGANHILHKISSKESKSKDPLRALTVDRRVRRKRPKQGLCMPEDTRVQVTGTAEGRAEGAGGSDTQEGGADPLDSGRGEDTGPALQEKGHVLPRCWWRGTQTMGTQTDTHQSKGRSR